MLLLAALAAAGTATGGCAAGGNSTADDSGAAPPARPADRAVTRGTDMTPEIRLAGQVSRVVDGDTIHVVSRGFETTVRLIGIDAPETHRPGTPVQCFGPEATVAATRLLGGRQVRLVSDPTQDRRDRYGRLLAYVYPEGDATSANQRLVEGGFARLYVYRAARPFRQAGAFAVAERRARSARRGLWGPPCNGAVAPAG